MLWESLPRLAAHCGCEPVMNGCWHVCVCLTLVRRKQLEPFSNILNSPNFPHPHPHSGPSAGQASSFSVPKELRRPERFVNIYYLGWFGDGIIRGPPCPRQSLGTELGALCALAP